MCAGRRRAWRWKIPWSGWTLCLSRCLPGGCRKKLWQALYYRYDFAKEYRPQLEENLLWLDGELKKIEGMQMRHKTIEKSDR